MPKLAIHDRFHVQRKISAKRQRPDGSDYEADLPGGNTYSISNVHDIDGEEFYRLNLVQGTGTVCVSFPCSEIDEKFATADVWYCCGQCHKPISVIERTMGTVCGKCCRENHKAAVGRSNP